MDLTRKINGIINPTRPFQESKPQNGDPDEFSSKPRRKTKISPSTKISSPTSCRMQKANIYNSAINEKKMLTKICYGYTESKRGDFRGEITKNFKEREIAMF